jgi:hypothetical protein
MATMKRVFIIAFLSLIPALARGDSVWTYQGNLNGVGFPGQSEGYTLTGTVLLNNNDQAIAWNFTTGTPGNTVFFTNFNSTGTINPFASSGSQVPFAFWNISLSTQTGDVDGDAAVLESNNYIPGKGGFDDVSDFNGGYLVYEVGNPGVWTEVVSTPEPGALLLLGAGIGALALTISLQKFRAA